MSSRDMLTELGRSSGGPHVSIYAPMHVKGADTRENPIRFKNRLQEAEHRLRERGMDEREAEAFLADGYRLVDDNDFWQHQLDGFAMFLGGERSERVKLPYAPPELTVVGNRFHLKPLMPLLAEGGRYYLLAVSLNEARLYEAGRRNLRLLELPEDIPTSLEEATRYDVEERSLQHHQGSAAGSGGGAGATRGGAANREGIFHGTGDETRDKKEDVRRWFAWLDNGVRKVLGDATEPLVFAGVDYLFPIFRDANQYPHLHDTAGHGNPDGWSEAELLEQGWQAVRPHFEQPRVEALQRYTELAASERASDATDEIVLAAVDGRVDTLIVGIDAHLWGEYDARNRSLMIKDAAAEESVDLLDLAAVETIANGGTVYAVPTDNVPHGGNMVAIFRF